MPHDSETVDGLLGHMLGDRRYLVVESLPFRMPFLANLVGFLHLVGAQFLQQPAVFVDSGRFYDHVWLVSPQVLVGDAAGDPYLLAGDGRVVELHLVAGVDSPGIVLGRPWRRRWRRA